MNAATDLPPVELQAPDITPWKDGNTGVPWVHVLQGSKPGPKVNYYRFKRASDK